MQYCKYPNALRMRKGTVQLHIAKPTIFLEIEPPWISHPTTTRFLLKGQIRPFRARLQQAGYVTAPQ